VGVANAVCIGGAGAIFWMWISALFAMILKYAETVLAVAHRRERRQGGYFGGACYYIKDHFFAKRRYRMGIFLSILFAALMILNALSMGCIIQVNAISSAFEGILKFPNWMSGLLLTVCLLPFLLRDTKGIAAFTEWLVPMMSVGYTVLSVAVLIMRRDALGEALASIFRQAFSAESMTGGVIGFLTSRAIRIGTMRGLLSNEAGCGTAPTAHAAAETNSPAAQGVWGIFEVFVDTILLCTATALVILVSDAASFGVEENAVMLTVRAYASVLGGWSEWFFAVAIFCFGFATVLCWANYGRESLAFITRKKRFTFVYPILLIVSLWSGVLSAPQSVWGLSDFAISALTTVNLTVLFCMRREVRTETKKVFWK
jgi:AGCS family alanine or glycine:cation symporter